MLPYLHDLTSHLPTTVATTAAAALHHSTTIPTATMATGFSSSSTSSSIVPIIPSNAIDYYVHHATSSSNTLIASLSDTIAKVTTTTTTRTSSSVVTDSSSSSSPVIDVLTRTFDQYKYALKEHPFRVKILTGCLLAIVGDALAQSRTTTTTSTTSTEQTGSSTGDGLLHNNQYDVKRAAAFVAFDGCWRAVQQFTYPPLIQSCHGQYLMGFLASIIPSSSSSSFHIQDQDPFLFAAMEQTLISQLVLIPCTFFCHSEDSGGCESVCLLCLFVLSGCFDGENVFFLLLQPSNEQSFRF
jgi:hypothetical protein